MELGSDERIVSHIQHEFTVLPTRSTPMCGKISAWLSIVGSNEGKSSSRVWKLPFETVKRIGDTQRTQVHFISSKGRHLDFEFDAVQKDLISEFLDY